VQRDAGVGLEEFPIQRRQDSDVVVGSGRTRYDSVVGVDHLVELPDDERYRLDAAYLFLGAEQLALEVPHFVFQVLFLQFDEFQLLLQALDFPVQVESFLLFWSFVDRRRRRTSVLPRLRTLEIVIVIIIIIIVVVIARGGDTKAEEARRRKERGRRRRRNKEKVIIIIILEKQQRAGNSRPGEKKDKQTQGGVERDIRKEKTR